MTHLADGAPALATVTDAATWEAPVHLWDDSAYVSDHGAEEADAIGSTPQEQPYDSADVPAPTPDGRAARRRQRERWKKTQRKALVATAVALVGGGMTVASLNRQAPDRTQAASAPDREPMGIAEQEITDSLPVPSTPADPQRAQHTSFATQSAATTANGPHEQVSVALQATPAAQVIHQRQATSPMTVVTSSAGSHAVSTRPEATGTATGTTASPAPSTGDSTGTGTSGTDTTSASPSPSGSAPTSATPSSSQEVCLLGLVCVS
nr:hypothetical protein [Streptomyces graminilatus]